MQLEFQQKINIADNKIEEVRAKFGRQLARLDGRNDSLKKAEAESVLEVYFSIYF